MHEWTDESSMTERVHKSRVVIKRKLTAIPVVQYASEMYETNGDALTLRQTGVVKLIFSTECLNFDFKKIEKLEAYRPYFRICYKAEEMEEGEEVEDVEEKRSVCYADGYDIALNAMIPEDDFSYRLCRNGTYYSTNGKETLQIYGIGSPMHFDNDRIELLILYLDEAYQLELTSIGRIPSPEETRSFFFMVISIIVLLLLIAIIFDLYLIYKYFQNKWLAKAQAETQTQSLALSRVSGASVKPVTVKPDKPENRGKGILQKLKGIGKKKKSKKQSEAPVVVAEPTVSGPSVGETAV
uniref:Uncharacterized protein n=1 Tax=Panagrellus redivivus TaxID=6233 RepID=A0A7E4VZ58_PANRE